MFNNKVARVRGKIIRKSVFLSATNGKHKVIINNVYEGMIKIMKM
jgi:hypothetical protein